MSDTCNKKTELTPTNDMTSKPPTPPAEEEDERLQRSPSILNATEQVVKAAVNMERSDSVFFDDEDDELLSGDDANNKQPTSDEEEPAIEAMLSDSMRKLKIVPSPRLRKPSITSHPKRASTESVSDFGEVSKFLTMESLDQQEAPSETPIPSPQPLHNSNISSGAHAELPSGPLAILESCGAMPLSLPELRTLYRRLDSSDADIATTILDARQKQQSRRSQQEQPQDAPILNDKDQAMLLHSMFVTFCSPPPSLDSITRILNMERHADYDNDTNVPLPKDSLISVSGAPKVSVISLLTNNPKIHLLRLPLAFQLAFFRILIRLLTNETDVEHDQECLFACDWVQDDDRSTTFGDTSPEDEIEPELLVRRKAIRTMRESLMDTKKVAKAAHRPNQLYTVVRFRSGTAWKESVVTSLLNLFRILLDDDKEDSGILLAPVSRLMGLCATARVEIKELREMLALAGRPFPVSEQAPTREPGLDRLLMIRAITTAAEGSSRSSLLVGKASPRYFFSFGLGHGLARTFQSMSTWPFRNDFGMAVWFRAESLDFSNSRKCPKLLSARTHDGGGIDVSLMPLRKKEGSDTPATVIAVTVFDSQANGKEASEVQQIKLERCVLLPQVWYHVAVRHTRSRLKGVFSMSSRQHVSIMLDGKIMLTESLKFPKISLTEGGTESPSATSLLRGSLRRQSGRPSGSTMTIQCGAHFEGQTGTFYVFNENVSDATLRSLYEISGGTDGIVKRRSLKQEDSSWDERRSTIAVRSHALSVEIKNDDVEEIVLSKHENEPGRSDSNVVDPAVTVADMGDDGQEESDLPPELSKASFGSKLFLVWDPHRVEDQVALDLHSGAHVRIDTDNVKAWHVDGAKSVVGSIGGVQAIIPILQATLAGRVEQYWPFFGNKGTNDLESRKRTEREKVYILVPCLFALVSSFLRNHGENTREMLRCGGIDILEQLLVSNKTLSKGSDESQVRETLTSVLTVYPELARRLVTSLLDTQSACSHYTGLETIVFSRLLFNFQLWFSSPSQAFGVALYGTLLPVLSALSKMSPRKVRDCVGVRPMVEQLREFTSGKETERQEVLTELFDRSSLSGLHAHDKLTTVERRHVVDVLLAMTSSLLAAGTFPDQLQPLLNYISYNINTEWEQASEDIRDGNGPTARTGVRLERYSATVKASTVLLCLLQARPDISGLVESLSKCCGGELGAAGWLLCCLVNTYDDDLRSIGIRCVSAYLDRVAPEEDAMLTMVSSDHSALQSEHSVEAASNQLLHFASNRVLSSAVLTNTLSNVGKGLAAIGNSGALSQILPSSKVSVKVVYKLLWHLLKCHRERSDKSTHAALLQILLENGELMHSSISSMNEFVVKNDLLRCGYTINTDVADISSLSLGSYSDEKMRQTQAISTILLLLRFFPSNWREQWLRVLVDMCQASRSNVEVLLSSTQWQPPLFHLVSDVVEEMATKCLPEDSDLDHRSGISKSFDLCFKLYASVLGHCFRHGGDQVSILPNGRLGAMKFVVLNSKYFVLTGLTNTGTSSFASAYMCKWTRGSDADSGPLAC